MEAQNRIIKFRVFDNVDYMSKPFTLQDIQAGKIQFTSECKVMQFTGLHDKNGKEIYEGDIIDNRSPLNFMGNSWAIEFKDGSFLMRFISGGSEPKNGFILAYDFNLEIYEIIGDIYSNPELISNPAKSDNQEV